jgi:hypothetical protein
MNDDQLIVYFFNNCHARDHEALFESGAFFDLSTTGKQGTQAINLRPGQVCVVATLLAGNRVAFRWYLFVTETVLADEYGEPARVFFGKVVASEIYSKRKGARSVRYKTLFKDNGDFKNGSVFHRPVPLDDRPVGTEGGNRFDPQNSNHTHGGAGFGDSIENKLVEAAAISAVKKEYENNGWNVCSVERDRCGFDLECHRRGVVENVEVKGVRATEQRFNITAGEVAQAQQNSKFVLWVITSALCASPILSRYSGVEFCRRFDRSPIQYLASLRP